METNTPSENRQGCRSFQNAPQNGLPIYKVRLLSREYARRGRLPVQARGEMTFLASDRARCCFCISIAGHELCCAATPRDCHEKFFSPSFGCTVPIFERSSPTACRNLSAVAGLWRVTISSNPSSFLALTGASFSANKTAALRINSSACCNHGVCAKGLNRTPRNPRK